MKKNKPVRRWLWFRGLIRWHVHWGDFYDEFKKTFPDDEVIMIDFPGFGNFHHLKSPRTMAGMLQHVQAQIKNDPGPFHILAFSLGGMVASHFSAQFPHLVTQQFLINTSDRKSPFYLRFRVQQWGLLFSNITHPVAEKIEMGVLKAVSNYQHVKDQYYPRFVEEFKKAPVERQNLLNQLHIASKTQFPEKSGVPTEILASKGDQLVHYSCSEKIAKSWGITPHLHSSGGHDLSLDEPQWVLAKITENLL